VRDDLGNRAIRIILRTGQPGCAPEREVVADYDVNDYRSKGELTAQNLFTALVGAIRAWQDIARVGTLVDELSRLNDSLEKEMAERTVALRHARDSTEMALAREREARHQLSQFLSMMSHEFRTPLAIIDSAAQMLLLRGSGRDAQRLEAIRGGVFRLIDLLDTCVADETLEAGGLLLHERPVDLAATVVSVVAQHRKAVPLRAIEVRTEPAPPAWGDAALLRLVVGNLIANALKYSQPDTPVEVTVEAADDAPRVIVRDHGIGIPPEDLPRIFERFYRASNVDGFPGSGIGLHMAHQIVDLHGGSIAVDSRLGCGSVFTVRLRPFSPGEEGVPSEMKEGADPLVPPGLPPLSS
jgi:signal transduction histidine kinase